MCCQSESTPNFQKVRWADPNRDELVKGYFGEENLILNHDCPVERVRSLLNEIWNAIEPTLRNPLEASFSGVYLTNLSPALPENNSKSAYYVSKFSTSYGLALANTNLTKTGIALNTIGFQYIDVADEFYKHVIAHEFGHLCAYVNGTSSSEQVAETFAADIGFPLPNYKVDSAFAILRDRVQRQVMDLSELT